VTATISNDGDAASHNVVVRFNDGAAVIGETTPLATVGAGAVTQVRVTWNTTNVQGDRVITSLVDSSNNVHETQEDNNEGTAYRHVPKQQGSKRHI
jgi:subtilase family serine protease